MIFPGNQLLLTLPGVQVRATPTARQAIQTQVEGELHWFRHGPEFVERAVRAAYHSDPLVMGLLELYLRRMDGTDPDDDFGPGEEELEHWPRS